MHISLLASLVLVAAAPQEPVERQGFTGLLAVTTDRGFDDLWAHRPGDVVPEVQNGARVVPGQAVRPLIFFTGASEGADGARISCSLVVNAPDGSLHERFDDLEGFRGRLPGGGGVIRCAAPIDLSFEPGSALGRYDLTLEVTDEVTGESSSARAGIELAAFEPGEGFKDKDAIGRWMMAYFEAPSPERAPAAFRRTVSEGLWDDPRTIHVSQAFFGSLFASEPFLFGHLFAGWGESSKTERDAMLELLALSGVDAQPLLAELDEGARAAYQRFAAAERRDPYAGPVETTGDVDLLWAEFFATGRFAPVQRVAALLGQEPPPPDQLTEVERNLGGQSLVQAALTTTLRTHLLRHERVRHYCRWMLERGELPEPARRELTTLLGG